MEVAIAIGALVASIVPLWATWVTTRARSDRDYTRTLEERYASAQRDLERALETVRELRDENLDLMRRLMKEDE